MRQHLMKSDENIGERADLLGKIVKQDSPLLRISWLRWWSLMTLLAVSGSTGFAWAAQHNGFVLDGASVPVREIKRGGPPRDGIPAIDRPKFVPSSAARFLQPEDRVLGYADRHGAKAYPIRIMNWHEIVNDESGDDGLLITYCPLCGTGMAFSVVHGKTFGVSGLLYNSDVLLYDRETESLWSQIMGRAIAGPRQGELLELVPLRPTTWDAWRSAYPDTLVLSPETGYRIDYQVDPYEGYDRSKRLMFSVSSRDQSYHPKALVTGVVIDGKARAYPFEELAKLSEPLVEQIGSTTIRVRYDGAAKSAWLERLDGGAATDLASVTAFWFAWYAFHPDTSVFVYEP